MKWTFIPSIAVVICCIVAAPASNIAPSAPPLIANGSALFTNYTAASFRLLPAANQTIFIRDLDFDLLDAAVFHETNYRRQQAGLRALAYSEKAREAARIQARAMSRGQFVEHTNPNPGLKTSADRAYAVGLHPRFLGENVASAFGRRYKSGQGFYTREQNGQKIYSFQPNGPPIGMHTYLTFAQALLDEWMESPPHRANILHKSPEYLGCANEPSPNESSMEMFYCAQFFFATF
jgi:uncharacterized protein YkwD